MAHFHKADKDILRPGIVVGKHPGTGIIHRLTIRENGEVIIERKPFVSPIDGWTQKFETLTTDATNQTFLILTIRQNPVDWPE